MAVAVEFNFPGATAEQYDAAIEAIGHGATGTLHVGGALFHWATVTSDGVRVVDVWESREQFDRFAEERVGPAVQQAGLPTPEIQFSDIHNYLTRG